MDDTQYFSSTQVADYVTLGYNFRMSSLTAALGISQIQKSVEIIEKRRERSSYFTSRLKAKVGDAVHFPKISNSYFHVYQLYTIIADKRDELKDYLASKGIMTKIYFIPVHLTYFYHNIMGYECKLPITEELAQNVLTLPMYPSLNFDEIDYIVDEIKTFYGGNPYV
jgi:perosamine synthetase